MKVKIFGKEIERRGTLAIRKKKHVVKNGITKIFEKKIIKKEDITSLIKYIEIEKLNINVLVGVILLFPTIFAVPILATLFEYLKTIHFKKFDNFNYSVLPVYDELKLFFEVDTVVKVRTYDLVKFVVKILTNVN